MIDATRQLAACEAQFLAASGWAERVVDTLGFRAHLWTMPDPFYRSVAVPIARQSDWAPAIAEMRAVFRALRRQPAVEFSAECWPRLGPALERAGFADGVRLTAMAHDGSTMARLPPCPPAPAPPCPAAPAGRPLDGSTPLFVLGTYLEALHGIFDERRPIVVEIDEAARLRLALVRGRTQIDIVTDDSGRAIAGANLVGIGHVAGIAGPAAELAGVWTAQSVRGRGLARRLVAGLLQRFFAAGGGLVWLAADDRLAAGLYTRLGFRPVGRLMRYWRDTA